MQFISRTEDVRFWMSLGSLSLSHTHIQQNNMSDFERILALSLSLTHMHACTHTHTHTNSDWEPTPPELQLSFMRRHLSFTEDALRPRAVPMAAQSLPCFALKLHTNIKFKSCKYKSHLKFSTCLFVNCLLMLITGKYWCIHHIFNFHLALLLLTVCHC